MATVLFRGQVIPFLRGRGTKITIERETDRSTETTPGVFLLRSGLDIFVLVVIVIMTIGNPVVSSAVTINTVITSHTMGQVL